MPSSRASIRPAVPDDEAALLDICLRTADRGQDGSSRYSDPRLPGLLWAVPYLRFCPEHAFVLTRNGEVVGYSVATADTKAYESRLHGDWWPGLRAELRSFQPATPEDRGVADFLAAPAVTPDGIAGPFPAHLHINLLPHMQGGGHGSTLLRHQLDSLAAAGRRGVHLGIDPRNEAVTDFYRRFGFREIARNPSIVMARTLQAGVSD